jgi:pyruvate/2-oxoglutarate dehydrogenase complex dihydrolipoamide acyltransferase (E2) component
MSKPTGYKVIPLSFNRRAVIASATVTKEKNAIHCITEVDVTEPRRLINEHLAKTNEKLSFTAYLVACLVHVVKDHPEMNSFHKGRKQIILDDISVNVLIEREIKGEKVPEPLGITKAQLKTYRQIHEEIREAQKNSGSNLGNLTAMTWIRFIPGFLMRTFIRLADRNIAMAKRYGKICVTAVGMYNKDSAWFIPHGTATVLVTVGGISDKVVLFEGKAVNREYLCLTISFDHNIVDGAPAARFVKELTETIRSGELIIESPYRA